MTENYAEVSTFWNVDYQRMSSSCHSDIPLKVFPNNISVYGKKNEDISGFITRW